MLSDKLEIVLKCEILNLFFVFIKSTYLSYLLSRKLPQPINNLYILSNNLTLLLVTEYTLFKNRFISINLIR